MRGNKSFSSLLSRVSTDNSSVSKHCDDFFFVGGDRNIPLITSQTLAIKICLLVNTDWRKTWFYLNIAIVI